MVELVAAALLMVLIVVLAVMVGRLWFYTNVIARRVLDHEAALERVWFLLEEKGLNYIEEKGLNH